MEELRDLVSSHLSSKNKAAEKIKGKEIEEEDLPGLRMDAITLFQQQNMIVSTKETLISRICTDLNIERSDKKKRKTINTLIMLRIDPNFKP